MKDSSASHDMSSSLSVSLSFRPLLSLASIIAHFAWSCFNSRQSDAIATPCVSTSSWYLHDDFFVALAQARGWPRGFLLVKYIDIVCSCYLCVLWLMFSSFPKKLEAFLFDLWVVLFRRAPSISIFSIHGYLSDDFPNFKSAEHKYTPVRISVHKSRL